MEGGFLVLKHRIVFTPSSLLGFFISAAFLLQFVFAFTSCNQKSICEHSPSAASPIEHKIWNELLSKYVNDEGFVNYSSIAKDPQLEEYLSLLSSAHPDTSWKTEVRLAYWINAYNAFTVKLIVDHYPVSSIKDIPNRWSIDFIELEGINYSLADIEHRILRTLYKEERIHFAINCASFSCPKLSGFSYQPEQLDKQLDKAARSFINDPNRNQVSMDKMKLSKIFKWFQKDFTTSTSLEDYIKKYADKTITSKTKVEYLEYNWVLNDWKP